MEESSISRIEMVNRINKNGGQIKQPGFSHWIGKSDNKRTPNRKNAVAIELSTDSFITVFEIMNS